MRHVGIDLGLKGPHRAAVFEDGKPLGKPFRMDGGRSGIDCVEKRAMAGQSDPCEFVMEATGLAWLPLAAELARRGHAVFVPDCAKLSMLRKFYARHTKSDSVDAYAQGMVRHVDPEGTHPLVIPSASQTMLRMIVKQRARMTKDIGRAKTRIRGWLVLASPSLNAALPARTAFSAAGRALLKEQLDPFLIRNNGKPALEVFWASHAGRRTETNHVDAVWSAALQTCDFYEELHAAGQLPFDYGLLQKLVSGEFERIEALEEAVKGFDTVIERLYLEVDPEQTLQWEVPGVGPAIAPTLEAFIGSIGRFRNIKAFAAYFGYVPRTHQTGGGAGRPQPLTKAGPNLAKQHLFLAAETARRLDPELAVSYRDARARGKHHIDAVCIVAHKLVRRIYAVLKQREAHRVSPAARVEAPPARWRYTDPLTGQRLSRKEARRWVDAHCPSVAEQARRASVPAAAGGPDSGSSTKDATTASPDALPPSSVASAPGGCLATTPDLAEGLQTTSNSVRQFNDAPRSSRAP